MKRLRLLIVTGSLMTSLMTLAGCEKKADRPAVAQPVPTAAQTVAPSATQTVVPATEAPADQAGAPAADMPPSISEVDSETETVGPAQPTAAQPLLLRVGNARPAPPSQFKEGVHYQRLLPTQPTLTAADRIEVAEAFWYGCPHCYELEPFIETWRKDSKPAYVNFVRIPVVWNERTRMHARVYYTAELLGRLEDLHAQIFRETHSDSAALATPESIEAFFTARNVSKDAFDQAYSSSAVETKVKRAATLNQRYGVEGVPTVIVNGKYVSDVGKAGGQQALIALINELVQREHGA